MEQAKGWEQREALNAYFRSNGLLLCNTSRDLPYLELVGGDWNSIVSLIQDGSVYYSKLYQGRVTYLSKEFYANVKLYRQRRNGLRPTAISIYDFLAGVGKATTTELKNTLMLPAKSFSESMNALQKELLVTAIGRDRTIQETWSSFYWGTYETWEALHPIDDIPVSGDTLAALTRNILPEKALQKLLK